MDETINAPLMENPHVQELLAALRDNDADATNLTAMMNHVSAVERFMEQANGQLAAMRRELADIHEIQKHPIKTALQNSIQSLQSKLNAAMEWLGEVKAGIIEGCIRLLLAIKEQGKAALNGMMKFFHIKGGLEAIRDSCTASIQEDNKAIAKIEAFSQQYHETGKAFGNMGRVLFGKEAKQDAKPVGKLAHTLEAPYKADRAISAKMRNACARAIGSLERLDAEVSERRAEKTAAKSEKTSLLQRLDENKERAARESLERSLPERALRPREAIG
jgi:hypothetical protein